MPGWERILKLPRSKSLWVNGDKVGLIVLNDFLHSGLNAIPLFVIPAFAGMTEKGFLFSPNKDDNPDNEAFLQYQSLPLD